MISLSRPASSPPETSLADPHLSVGANIDNDHLTIAGSMASWKFASRLRA